MSNNQSISHGTVDVQEAAELFKVHPNQVRAFIESGELPAAKFGRPYVMLRSDVMAMIEKRILQQTEERMKRRKSP